MPGTLLPDPTQANPAAGYTTPQQITSLYDYANALAQPVPVNPAGKISWTQGLADALRAGIGGYLSHEADVKQQQALQEGAAQVTPIVAKLLNWNNGASSSGAPAQAPQAPQQDPIAAAGQKVASIESGGNYGAVGPTTSSGDRAYGKYGVMGENVGPWTKEVTGTAMSPQDFLQNPQIQDAVFRNKFGSYAQQAGDIPDAASMWFTGKPLAQGANLSDQNGMTGARYAAAVGGQTGGIPASTMATSAPGYGAGLSGINPAQISAMLANPYVPESTKATVLSLVQLHPFQDAMGGLHYTSPQAGDQPVVPGMHFGSGPAGVPIGVSGFPGAPQTSILAPQTPGGTASPSQFQPQQGTGVPPPQSNAAGGPQPTATGPIAPYMPYIKAAQAAAAQGSATNAIAQEQAKEYTDATAQAEAARNASYPLHQAQALFEKNGGVLPTGQGSQDVMGTESLANMVSTWLGHPLTDEDSKLTSLQLLHKYGTQIASAQAQNVNINPTNLGLTRAAETSPGTELTGPANLHLIDNLVRLNDLNQKYFQAKQDAYRQNGNLDGFQKQWADSVDGGNAVPLSKYPVTQAKGPDGQLYDKVPSTDQRGFSWVKDGTIQ